MVYNPNANWTAAAASNTQATVYYIAIDGLATPHYSTGPVRSAAVTKKRLLNLPSSIGQKIDQLTGRQTMNLLTIELIDRDDEMTDLFGTEKSSPTLASLVNRRVTLYCGFASLAEADYAPIAIGEISNVTFTGDDGNILRLTLRDLKRVQQAEIFTNAEATGSVPVNTYLTAAATAGDLTLALNSTANISTDDVLYLCKVSTDTEEKVTVLDVIDSFTIRLDLPVVNSYGIGDEVRWATTVIHGNVIDIIYAVWTSSYGTPSSPGSGSFPLDKVRGQPTGLGLAAGDIDTAGLIIERDRMLHEQSVEIEIKDAVTAVRFLEDRLYRLYGYPVVRADGKLSFRAYRPAYGQDAAAGLSTITEADIESWELVRDHRLHVNRVSVGVDLELETGEPAQTITNEDTSDQTLTDEIVEIEVLNAGLTNAKSGVRLADGRWSVLARRFLKPPVSIKIETRMHKRALEVGDVILLTHSRVPNVNTGARGYTGAHFEIVEREAQYEKDLIRFTLQEVPYTRPSWIGPSGTLPDYDTATAAQRLEYAFIGPSGSPVGNFSDGSPPYEVQ